MATTNDFPFKTVPGGELHNPEIVLHRFENLKKYVPQILVSENSWVVYNALELNTIYLPLSQFTEGRPAYVLLINNNNEYWSMNCISDYANEYPRGLTVRFDNPENIYGYWKRSRGEINRACLSRYGYLHPFYLRETVESLFYMANAFRPSLVVSLIKMFGFTPGETNMLDISSGWGDRMIGAMAAGVKKYVGTDPNTLLHPGYEKLQKLFESRSKTKVKIFPAGFETVSESQLRDEFDGPVDFVFTSPPYFVLEIYSQDETQSVKKFPGVNDWLDKWLIPGMNKCAELMRPGGVMVININNIVYRKNTTKVGMNEDVKFIHLLDSMLRRLRKDLIYCGVIGYANEDLLNAKTGSAQPMFVWRKFDLAKLYACPDIQKFDKITVFNDWVLPGGSKMRAAIPFVTEMVKKHPELKEIVYAGPSIGLAQVAISIACMFHNLRATIFVTDMRDDNFICRARMFGGNIIVKQLGLGELSNFAVEYVNTGNKTTPGSIFLLEFGVADVAEKMVSTIRECVNSPQHTEVLQSSREIYVTAGSSVLANAISKVVTDKDITLVQVGKKIWPDQIPPRGQLMVSEKRFAEPRDVDDAAPYPSIPKYDEKVYKFAREKLNSDPDTSILIWNVGAYILPEDWIGNMVNWYKNTDFRLRRSFVRNIGRDIALHDFNKYRLFVLPGSVENNFQYQEIPDVYVYYYKPYFPRGMPKPPGIPEEVYAVIPTKFRDFHDYALTQEVNLAHFLDNYGMLRPLPVWVREHALKTLNSIDNSGGKHYEHFALESLFPLTLTPGGRMGLASPGFEIGKFSCSRGQNETRSPEPFTKQYPVLYINSFLAKAVVMRARISGLRVTYIISKHINPDAIDEMRRYKFNVSEHTATSDAGYTYDYVIASDPGGEFVGGGKPGTKRYNNKKVNLFSHMN